MKDKINFVAAAFVLAVILNLFPAKVFASGFMLNSIGSVPTSGQQISHWWYTSTSPVFHGVASPGAAVVANIDSKSEQINADSSGNWDYSGGDLGAGDHEITFTSDGSTIKFTLTLGTENVDWASIGSGSAETLPATGNLTPTILMLIGGLGIIGMGGKMVLNVNKN